MDKNILFYIIAISQACTIILAFKCNIYPYSPLKCISSTSPAKCKYDFQENTCLEVNQINLGCQKNFNLDACIMQLKNLNGEPIQCGFFDRCQEISLDQLKNIGCSDKLSKYACLKVDQQKCIWDNICKDLNEHHDGNSNQDIFNMPVTPFTCQNIQFGLYLSNGFDGDFRCTEMRLDQLSMYQCDSLGINQNGCVAITNKNQLCIFQSNICQTIKSHEIKSCDQNLNRNACLSVKSQNINKLFCQWKDSKCSTLNFENIQCHQQKQVNESVCQQSSGYCMYNEDENICITLKEVQIKFLQCNAPGLSRDACLKIKSQNCSFQNGMCQVLDDSDLNSFQCNMELNEMACINLKTSFQYCVWDGKSCQRLFMNQDVDCPLVFEKKKTKVNGNVCQAISKPYKMCKYDLKQKLCINSSLDDECNTPFLNKSGCVNIQKYDQSCQWTYKGCIQVKVEIGQTKCESLENVNAFTCSQVYENNNVGCYYDNITYKCLKLDIDQDEKSKKILDSISCIDFSLGLNKVICSAITTQSTPCRWYKNQCSYLKSKMNIKSVPCQSLEFSNYQACALASFRNEPCQYLQEIRGCINRIAQNSTCDSPGINSIACSQLNCQFEKVKCVKFQSQIDILNDEQGPSIEEETNDEQSTTINQVVYNSKQKCATSSLSKIECSSIITKNQLCIWSFTLNSCAETQIYKNLKCLDFVGSTIIINPNVCASLLPDTPEYCAYNRITKNCKIQNSMCTTKCCTNKEYIGSNAYTCGRFSRKQIGVYCYFKDNICQELTADTVDISNSNLVKQYFNELKLPCTSMNMNSCHMIDWSTSQQCYYNGFVCTNINFSIISDLRTLTQQPFILNEYACLAIEGRVTKEQSLKYFTYVNESKICKEFIFDEKKKFEKCETAYGNKNVCTRYTGNNFCLWDSDNLKCVSITQEYLWEMQTCNSNLNIKACTEGLDKQLACFFSYESDLCTNATQTSDCNYFDSKGLISEAVCKGVIKEGQLCEYSNLLKKCVESKTQFENCNISSTAANMRVCYKNTNGNCRWDTKSLECYENQIEISELSCTDNLNYNLCVKVVKEPCLWNDKLFECQLIQRINPEQLQEINQGITHLFNEKACLLISGVGYYFDKILKKCIKLDEKNNQLKCNDYQLNQYACLYQTRKNLCYYDVNEQPPNNLCKFFEDQQSLCSTQNLINIEVCMNLPVPCIFNETTLKCEQFEVTETMTCSYLQAYSTNKMHHNKIACASVSSSLTDVKDKLLCSQDKGNAQKCTFEKNCIWSEYTCQHFDLLIDYFETGRGKNQSNSNCPEFQEQNDCKSEVFDKQTSNQYIQEESIVKIENKWQSYNSTCQNLQIKHFMEQQYKNKMNLSEVCKIVSCFYQEQIYCQSFNDIMVEEYEEYNDEIKKTIASYAQISLTSTQENVCLKEYSFPFDYILSDKCNPEDKFLFSNWCNLVENEIKTCNTLFSKSLCLEVNSQLCMFDIQQGGCIQIKGQEHKIPNCSSISNDCNISQSIQAICQKDQLIKQPGDICQIFSKDQQTCKKLDISSSQFKCDEIQLQNSQPILCAQAIDECRFDGNSCISSIKYQNGKCLDMCDKSFSQKLCEFCGCNYQYLGYCQQQQQPPQLNEDCTNQYYLCYEVQQLQTKFKQHVCGSVDQACKYTDKCEDATHSTCEELQGFIVSQQACIRCKGLRVKYDQNTQICNVIDLRVNSCENLNQQACIQSRNILCKWDKSITQKCNQQRNEQSCQEISNISQVDQLDCSILNFDACKLEQSSILCWFNQDTQLCQNFNPYQGNCNTLMNKKLCNLSMFESCAWISGEMCVSNFPIPDQTCLGLNKFGCLNQVGIACAWSDKLLICEEAKFSNKPLGCDQFLEFQQQSYVTHNNVQTCSLNNANQSCVFGNNFKCRDISEPTLYACNTPGLNKRACILNTKGFCAFQNQACILLQNFNLGCISTLNKQNCLQQNDICQFDKECQTIRIQSLAQITSKSCPPFTKMVCEIFNQDNTALIYSSTQKICLRVNNLNLKLTQCSLKGINKYTCLNHIEAYCEYKNNKCQDVNPSNIKYCYNTLNKFSCTHLDSLQCKYRNNQCGPLTESDKCLQFSQNNSQVNPKICSSDQTDFCYYDSITETCQILSSIIATCKGLNKNACIFRSNNSLCQFIEQENVCEFSFGESSCIDLINQRKCLSITKKGENCCFIEMQGCQNINTSLINIEKCQSSIQTNPSTCSESQDIPCFYDKNQNICVQYETFTLPINLNSVKNYQLSNLASFNKLTCEQFNQVLVQTEALPKQQDVLLFWQDSCYEVKGSQLQYLKCNQNLNRNACVSIMTPGQYCHYINNKCINANLEDYSNIKCQSIQNINSGAFCSQTKDVACLFNQQLYRCESIENSEIIRCVDTNPDQMGYNQLGCQLDQKNCIFQDKCYRINETYLQFCDNANDKAQCSLVQIENCKFIEEQCIKITKSEYETIKCFQAVNKAGCVNIKTKGELCQFYDSKCNFVHLNDYKKKNCLQIKNINHYSFCEQTIDVGCVYDQDLNQCKIVYEEEYLTCQRGLNKIACLQYTDQRLQCAYLGYCYGPNTDINNCTSKDQNICCRRASQIQTCLNQNLYKCQWINDKCQGYNFNQSKQCNEINNSSKSVCNSIESQYCMYDSINFKCLSLNPKSCDELQSSAQCRRISTLACIWQEDSQSCIFLENQSQINTSVNFRSSFYMDCQDITNNVGNQRACMNIVKEGQFCIFQNNQCQTFQQVENTNNCLNNININSCLQQTISDCYWKSEIIKVKKGQDEVESNVEYGQCIQFQQYDKQWCDQNLSYTSCLKINREQFYCTWQNQKCQSIQLNKVMTYDSFSLIQVNSQACSLINNGDIVKYDQELNKCIQVNDISKLSCLEDNQGINKTGCLKIKNQNCFWDQFSKVCRFKRFQEVQKQPSCKISNWSQHLCSQLTIQQPCGFFDDGCDFVDLNQINCDYQGLNKYACLNIVNYSCIWTKDQNEDLHYCKHYIPYTNCNQVPQGVNYKVCQLVQEDACYYDQINFKCQIPESQSCDLIGLNIKGCVQIDNCFFNQKCQKLNKNNYNCEEFPIANKQICKNAIDSCKYDDISYGCSQAQNEICSNDSLSNAACQNQNDCLLQNDICQCKYIDNVCNNFTKLDECNKQQYCYYQQQNNNISQLQQNNGCRYKSCFHFTADECDGQIIQNSLCYLTQFNKCQSAYKCLDIVTPNSGCSKYSFNNKPCFINQSTNQCQEINCLLLSRELCLQYPYYCKFEETCQEKICSDFDSQTCNKENCDWNSNTNLCEQQIECNKRDQNNCIIKKFKDRQCFWINYNENQLCTDTPCRYLSKSQPCSGYYDNQICVELKDSTCVSCEEISNSCECLIQQQYCKYVMQNNKCISKTNCKDISEQEKCQNIDECEWIESNRNCKSKPQSTVINKQDSTGQKAGSSLQNKSIVIIALMLILY